MDAQTPKLISAAFYLCLAVAKRDPGQCRSLESAPRQGGLPSSAETCRNFYNRAILSRMLIAHDPGFDAYCRKGSVDSGEDHRSSKSNRAMCDALRDAGKDPAAVCRRIVPINHPADQVAAELPKCVARFNAYWGLAARCAREAAGAREYEDADCLVSDAAYGFRRGECRSPLCRAMRGEGPKVCEAYAMDWVTIPGGSYVMGQGAEDRWPWAKPPHKVQIEAFQLARTPVTNRQYGACVKAGACAPAHYSDGKCEAHDETGAHFGKRKLPPGFDGPDQPVVCVDWSQAKAFSEWAGGRLPSETEWEYAALSGGKSRRYPWGDEEASCDYAVMASTASGGDGCGRRRPWNVCSRPKGNTEQGLCDMAGEVWEWTQDRYHQSYAGAPADGRPWDDSGAENRIVRGGSWALDAWHLRSANRGDAGPGDLGENYGFRPARSLERPSEGK